MVSKRPLIVEKFGTSSTTNERGPDYERIEKYVGSIKSRRKRYDTIVVASGSVATAWGMMWSPDERAVVDPPKRLLATMGSAEASMSWMWAGAKHHIKTSQILISHHILTDPKGSALLRDVFEESFVYGVLPVCNENDAVSDEEMKALVYGGDNDGIASHIATFMKARYLFLRTDVEGILKDGEVIPRVKAGNVAHVYDLLGLDIENPVPDNSMQSKIIAAGAASIAGVKTYICHADASFGEIIRGRTGTRVDLPLAA